VDQEPSTVRPQGRVDPFEVLHDRRSHGDVVQVSDGVSGKYKPELIKQIKIWGHDADTGKPVVVGGHLNVYRSAACKTAWVTTVKNAKFTKKARETRASIRYVDPKTHKLKVVFMHKTTKMPVSTKVVYLGKTTSVAVNGGFVADYQYEGGGTVVVRLK
jgi:hypothetical protein